MQVIDIKNAAPTRFTILIYGPSGAGKTQFSAGFPRPFFIADAVEGGWETIRTMDPGDFYEPGIYPEVVGIENFSEAQAQVEVLKKRIVTDPTKAPKTVVIDSLTFLSMTLQDNLLRGGMDVDKDRWAFYRALMNRLRAFMISVHQLNINVIWTALAKDSDSSPGPLIAGQTGTTLPAAVSLYFYMRVFQPNLQAEPIHEIRTRTYGGNPVRARKRLPDPLVPTYRALYEAYTRPNGAQAASPGLVPARTVKQPAPVVRR